MAADPAACAMLAVDGHVKEYAGRKGDLPTHFVARQGEPALTLVFGREGWSPALFRRLAKRGVAVIIWHKAFKGVDWPETAFHRVAVPVLVRQRSCMLARASSRALEFAAIEGWINVGGRFSRLGCRLRRVARRQRAARFGDWG